MNRREIRETSMKLLYEISINGYEYSQAIENFKENLDDENNKIENSDIEYIKTLLKGVNDNLNEIDKNIEKHLKNWKLERLSKIDLAILRICTYEILFKDDIPDAVSINEGIELAKKYSADKSAAFINGILDSLKNSKDS